MRSFPVLLTVALLVGVALAAEDVPSRNEKEKEAVDQSHLAPVTGEDVDALSQIECDQMNGSCTGCLNLPHCRYLIHHKTCIDESDLVKHKKAKIATSALSCPATADAPALANPSFRGEETNTTTETTPSTTSAPTNETTTSATPTTTPSPDNSTTTTTVQTTTTANLTTTTTESSTSTSSTTTTTTTPNSTTTTSHPVTTLIPTPTPDPSGRKFDGWSFFGGILVTLTIAAIGYMSFRYYKSRSGTGGGTNYNRF